MSSSSSKEEAYIDYPTPHSVIVSNVKYTIMRELGAGGFGRVVLAKNKKEEKVAIKLQFSPVRNENGKLLTRKQIHAKWLKLLDSYHNEVLCLDVCKGSSTVPLIAHSEEYPMILMVMPVASGSVHDLLRKGKLEIDVAMKYAIQLFIGLNYIHKMGVMHCDVKPANMLIFEHDVIKISDFGLADHFTVFDRKGCRGTLYYSSTDNMQRSKILSVGDDHISAAYSYLHMLTDLPWANCSTIEDHIDYRRRDSSGEWDLQYCEVRNSLLVVSLYVRKRQGHLIQGLPDIRQLPRILPRSIHRMRKEEGKETLERRISKSTHCQ